VILVDANLLITAHMARPRHEEARDSLDEQRFKGLNQVNPLAQRR
jgi:predicted nucleic acid-binding protein